MGRRHEFFEGLVPAPADPEVVEASSNLVDAVSSDPRSDGGSDRLPVNEALALIAKAHPVLRFDRSDSLRGVRCLEETRPLLRGDTNRIDNDTVGSGEGSAVGAIEIVAETLAFGAVDLSLGDMTERADGDEGDIGEGERHR